MIGNRYESVDNGNIVEWYSLSAYPVELHNIIKALECYSSDKDLSFDTRRRVIDLAVKLGELYESMPLKIEDIGESNGTN